MAAFRPMAMPSEAVGGMFGWSTYWQAGKE
jgi:hypothetical protein